MLSGWKHHSHPVTTARYGRMGQIVRPARNHAAQWPRMLFGGKDEIRKCLFRRHDTTGRVGLFSGGCGPVSATPGIIKGVVHFNASLVPDSMEVDAQDVTHTYNATATASQTQARGCQTENGVVEWFTRSRYFSTEFRAFPDDAYLSSIKGKQVTLRDLQRVRSMGHSTSPFIHRKPKEIT